MNEYRLLVLVLMTEHIAVPHAAVAVMLSWMASDHLPMLVALELDVATAGPPTLKVVAPPVAVAGPPMEVAWTSELDTQGLPLLGMHTALALPTAVAGPPIALATACGDDARHKRQATVTCTSFARERKN